MNKRTIGVFPRPSRERIFTLTWDRVKLKLTANQVAELIIMAKNGLEKEFSALVMDVPSRRSFKRKLAVVSAMRKIEKEIKGLQFRTENEVYENLKIRV